MTCPEQLNGTNSANYDLPKVSKININFELPKVSKMISLKIYIISSHREARNIKFEQRVNIIGSVPLGTPPQALVMTLARNHVTNLFIVSYRGATVIKVGQ